MIDNTLKNANIKNRNVMLLSLKPRWAEEILLGSKKWEYRRVTMHIKPGARMLFYASKNVHAIVGEALIETILNEPLDILVEHTINDVLEDKEDLKKYFIGHSIGHAIKIKCQIRYEKPLTLSNIREYIPKFMPPQGFYYLKDDNPLLKLLPSK